MLVFDEVQPTEIKIDITSSRGKVNLLNVEAFNIEILQDQLSRDNRVSTSNWIIVSSDGGEAHKAIDMNPNSFWRSIESNDTKQLTVDMGKISDIRGFFYEPRAGENKNGTIFKYRFSVSTNGTDWTEIPTTGEFSNIENNPITQNVYFDKTYKARYFKLEALREMNGRNFVTIGEVGVIPK